MLAALAHDSVESVRALCLAGADVRLTSGGQTAEALAASADHTEAATLLSRMRMVRIISVQRATARAGRCLPVYKLAFLGSKQARAMDRSAQRAIDASSAHQAEAFRPFDVRKIVAYCGASAKRERRRYETHQRLDWSRFAPLLR